jgi:hypothetical protein
VGATSFEPENPGAHAVRQGKAQVDAAERTVGIGSSIRFEVWLRQGLLEPAWAALCGSLASGGFVLSTEPLLRLALLIFLVGPLWGGLWSALIASDWATPLARWRNRYYAKPTGVSRTVAPAGPADRLKETWDELKRWWAELLAPTLGPTLAGLALLLPLTLVIAGILGPRPLLFTLVGISLIQFVFAWSDGKATVYPAAQALFEVGLPWLAGHGLFHPLTLASTALALGFTLAYAGGLRLRHGGRGLMRWNLGYGLAILVLVGVQEPLAAGIIGLLFLGQALLQPGLLDPSTDRVRSAAVVRFWRWVRPSLLIAMLVAAWAIRVGNGGA